MHLQAFHLHERPLPDGSEDCLAELRFRFRRICRIWAEIFPPHERNNNSASQHGHKRRRGGKERRKREFPKWDTSLRNYLISINIWRQMVWWIVKFCPFTQKHNFFEKVGSKFRQILNKPLGNGQRWIFLPKWRNFPNSGHTVFTNCFKMTHSAILGSNNTFYFRQSSQHCMKWPKYSNCYQSRFKIWHILNFPNYGHTVHNLGSYTTFYSRQSSQHSKTGSAPSPTSRSQNRFTSRRSSTSPSPPSRSNTPRPSGTFRDQCCKTFICKN